ncbi:MAG TPA: hypothetical protein VGY91_10020 [Chthoniobacterales bacterium]|jgi:hypothetical protein|nr:hypothetical protein [Chthoniobacterales bacterium]
MTPASWTRLLRRWKRVAQTVKHHEPDFGERIFTYNRPIMNFDKLLQFVERGMRMSHVYQPVMLRELLSRNGRAAVADIARALFNEDRSQIEYY